MSLDVALLRRFSSLAQALPSTFVAWSAAVGLVAAPCQRPKGLLGRERS